MSNILNKLRCFFDDPISNIQFWYWTKYQRQLRNSIDNKYNNEISNQLIWIPLTKEENKGLSEDKIERLSQRMILSQCGYLVAQRLHSKRNFIILPFLFIISLIFTYFLINKSPEFSSDFTAPVLSSLCIVLGVIVALGGFIFSQITAQIMLPNKALKGDEISTIENTIKRCLVKDNDSDNPPDFTDRLRVLDIDAEGNSVSGQILAKDLEYSSLLHTWIETAKLLAVYGIAFASPAVIFLQPNIAIILYLMLVLALQSFNPLRNGALGFLIFYISVPYALYSLFNNLAVPFHDMFSSSFFGKQPEPDTSFAKILLSWLFVLLCWITAIVKTMKTESPLDERGRDLDVSVKQTGTELLIDMVGSGYFKNMETAKSQQIINVKADKSPFIELGQSTSILSQRRDHFAPSEKDLPMGLSINDLSTHLFVLGASGTGKTTGVIRPIAHKWLQLNEGGMFAIDGKFALPLELADLTTDFKLISPATGKFNPIAGMHPDSVSAIIAEVCTADANETDPFWTESASLMLKMASVIVKYSSLSFTLKNIYEFCTGDAESRKEILFENGLKNELKHNKHLYSAVHYWLKEYPAIPEQTAGSISNKVRTWLGNIVAHEKLGDWVDTDVNTINVEDVFTGEKLGLLLPQSEYGVGGSIISALVMRLVYDKAKKRGDAWRKDPAQKPVLLIADEVQSILTQADNDNVAISRSLGLYLVMATQNIDGLYKRLNKDGTKQMLGNFASFIAFQTRTKDSNTYVSERFGKLYKSVVYSFNGLPDAKADLTLHDESGTDKMLRSLSLFNISQNGNPRNSWLVGTQEQRQTRQNEYSYEYIHNESATPTLNIKLVDLVDANEIETLLAVPQTALAIFNRGRVIRRDVIKLSLIGGAQ